MKNIDRRLTRLAIAEPVIHRNLSLFPLIDPEPAPADYLTLDEALKAKRFTITEVSDSGSVPELSVFNDGDQPVLLLDGEELVGARQDRVLNLTIMVAAQSAMTIPVSCVEQGRWGGDEQHFKSSKRTLYARGRAAKMGSVSESLRQRGRAASDQAQVWNNINEAVVGFDVHSPSSAMGDVYESQKAGIDEFEQAFQAQNTGQAGAVFVIAGEIAGCEVFDSDATWHKLAPKLIGSYALDALFSDEMSEHAALRPAEISAFLRQVALADATSHDAIGLGRDIRLGGSGLVGAALEVDERIVHLSAFRLHGNGDRRRHSRLISLARRRRNRQVH